MDSPAHRPPGCKWKYEEGSDGWLGICMQYAALVRVLLDNKEPCTTVLKHVAFEWRLRNWERALMWQKLVEAIIKEPDDVPAG